MYYPLAIIIGLVWMDYADRKKHEKPINISVKIFGWFAVIAGIAAMFTQFYLPAQIEDDIAEIKWFSLICLLVFGVGTLLFVKYKKYIGVFVFYVLFQHLQQKNFLKLIIDSVKEIWYNLQNMQKNMIIQFLLLIWIENIPCFIITMKKLILTRI